MIKKNCFNDGVDDGGKENKSACARGGDEIESACARDGDEIESACALDTHISYDLPYFFSRRGPVLKIKQLVNYKCDKLNKKNQLNNKLLLSASQNSSDNSS